MFGRNLIIKTPGWLVFIVIGVKPTNGSLIFKLFSKGDQLKVKLANLKFELDPSFYYLGEVSNRGKGL